MMMVQVIKHKRDTCQSRKIMMKSLMPRVSVEDQDGKSLRNIEMPSLNNSKKRKLREKLKPPPLLPLLLKEVKKVKKEVLKAKKKRKKRKRKPKPSHNQLEVMLNQLISLLNQSLMLRTSQSKIS